MSKKKMKEIISANEIPQDMILGEAIITLTGNHLLIIENYKSIIQFTDHLMILRAKKKKIIIQGQNLYIQKYDFFQMEIKGIINEIKILYDQR